MPCTGACCAAFPYSRDFNGSEDEKDRFEGLHLIDMLIPITRDEAIERWNMVGGPPEEAVKSLESDRQLYTCRHWNEETRLCTDYENRPRMCRGYPYGRPCEHGCDCADSHQPKGAS